MGGCEGLTHSCVKSGNMAGHLDTQLSLECVLGSIYLEWGYVWGVPSASAGSTSVSTWFDRPECTQNTEFCLSLYYVTYVHTVHVQYASWRSFVAVPVPFITVYVYVCVILPFRYRASVHSNTFSTSGFTT